MKKIPAILFSLLVVCLLAGGFLFWDLQRYAHTPADPHAGEVVFAVKSGENFQLLSRRLGEENVVKQPEKFSWYARIKGYDKNVKAGEYRLSASLAPRQILETLVSGKVVLHKVTIPEGYNMYQIAALLSQSGLMTQDAFLAKATDAALARKKGIDGDTFEGYLFPETYYFPKDVSADKFIATAVQRFNKVFLPEWKLRAREMDLSVHQVVTLASIIEKETGAAFERPLIASVFHNRLKKGIRLASDPTVIYGIKDFNGNLTRKDLETWSPYNTYRIRGLPPGPIANPGVASIEAALYPAETDFLYFVSKKDDTHQFSTNFEDHNRAVRKYQLKR